MRHLCKKKDRFPVVKELARSASCSTPDTPADPSGSSVIKQELNTKIPPEVFCDQKNLIGFQSCMENSATGSCLYEETVCLTVDPSSNASETDARLPQHYSTTIQYSTPIQYASIEMVNQQACSSAQNAITDQLEYTQSSYPRLHQSEHSSVQMAKCNSKSPSQCPSKEALTPGISQEILTRLHQKSNLSENVDTSDTEILSLTCSSTPMMEADSSVESSTENVLRVGTRVLAAWDRFRYYSGVIHKIDDEKIHVAFDMGDLKKYPLDCKDKIVIDRKAFPKELIADTPVLVKIARKKALYKGKIQSSGTIRGYCIIFDEPRRDRVWKRTKSLRVITDYVVVKGSPKLDNRDDTSCTSKEKATFLRNPTLKNNNLLNLPSQTGQSTEQGCHNVQYAKPKLFPSGLPTMVHYGQSTVLHFPKSTTDDRRITSEIQPQDDHSMQPSSNLYSSVSTDLQSSRAGSQSNLTDFYPNISETKLHSCVYDSLPDVSSFQSSVTSPRASLPSFQYNGLNPRRNLTNCQHTTDFNDANFQSKFAQEIFDYFPRRRNVSYGIEGRNMNCTVGNIHSPIMNMTVDHHQRLRPLYIGEKASDGSAAYYTLPTHSATSSPFNSSEIFSYESEDPSNIHWSSDSSTGSNQEKEGVLSKHNSNFWPSGRKAKCPGYEVGPSCYTTEEQSFGSLQDETCAPNKLEHLPISSDYPEFNHDLAYFIKQEHKRSCQFSVPSKMNRLSNLSSYDTQSYRQFDPPEDRVFAKKYCHEVSSTCSPFTCSARPTCAIASEQMMENIPPLCCSVPLQPPMSTPKESSYAIPPAYPAKPAYFIPPVHLEPPAYQNSPANFTPAYSTQPPPPTQLPPLTQFPPPRQPPELTPYPTQPAHQKQPAYQTKSNSPSYPGMPLITKVECSAKLDSLNQAAMNNSQEYEMLNSTKTYKNSTGERFNEQDLINTNAAVHFPPIGQNYAFQSSSNACGKNSEHDCRRSFENSPSPVTFSSECSDVIKFPLRRKEKKRKISALGFKNVQSSPSCKFRKVGNEEETIPSNVEAEEFPDVQNSSLVVSSSTIGETSSNSCMINSDQDQVGAHSPSVIKAARILTNSRLQRWQTFNNLNLSVEKSVNQQSALNETSTARCEQKSSDSCKTNGRRHEETNLIYTKMEKGNDRSDARSSNTTSVEQEKKDNPCWDEITICNVSNTHKTVAIQVQSKDTKPLRRPRICIPQQSIASQTQQQATSSGTILLRKYKKGKKIHSYHKPSSEMSPPKKSSNVKKVQKGKGYAKEEALALNDRAVEVETTSSDGFNTQQLDYLSLLAPAGETSKDGGVKSPAMPIVYHPDVGRPSSDSLSTIIENGNEQNLKTLLLKEKSEEKTAVQFEITSRQAEIKFVDDATTFLYSKQ